jgi:phospholipid/cholesterol/gamma-HCH transport system substrate-binding protein
MALEDLTPQLRVRLRRMERIVGVFMALAAVLLLSGFLYYLYHTAERKGWFVPKVRYFTFVKSADGLQVGDPVLLMGFSIGEITVIEAQPPDSYYNVFVGFEVKRPYYGYVWTDSKARIAAGDFLGRRQLEITKGYAGAPTAYEIDGKLREILVSGERVAIDESLQGVMLDPAEEPALAERAQVLVAQVEEALPKLLQGMETLLDTTSSLGADLGALVNESRPLVANLETITRRLRDPEGSLGEWLLPKELRAGLDQSVEGVNANLVELRRTLESVGGITSSLRTQVEGNDRMLSEISDLVVETDELVRGLKRHWLLRGSFPAPQPGSEAPQLEPLRAPPGEAR